MLKEMSNEELLKSIADLDEMIKYFSWKKSTPPYCNNSERVEAYQNRIAIDTAELIELQTELKQRNI